MYQVIALLNDIEKAWIFLYLEEKNYEEISNTLGKTEGNCEVSITEKFEQWPTYAIMTVFVYIAMMFFIEYSAKKCMGITLHN